MLRSLHARLATVLLALLLVIGAVNLASTLVTTRLYMNEVAQTMNLRLAQNIAAMKSQGLLDEDGRLREEGVEQILHWMMVVNPGPEFYVLDLRGRILAYDSMPGTPLEDRVSLAPIRDLLDRLEASGDGPMTPMAPIFGDDPREPSTPKVFSVALLPATGKPAGYLYVVLNNQPRDSVAEDLRGSYILRLGVRNGLAYLALAVALALLASFGLTRPLRRLAQRIEGFQLDPVQPLPSSPERTATDEVRLLETRFEEMTERLRRKMDHSEQMSELRRELMANISHDLRTPIATLRGYLETLSLRDEVLTAAQREQYLEIALRHSERLSRLVDELLELSKLDRREIEPDLDRFRIAELIQDNVQRFGLRAGERGVALRADFDPDLPPVYADVSLMERALENLIENALRHTEPGGTITVRLREEADRLVVSVQDTGLGIEAEDLPLIFDRFYRKKTTGDSEGAGLGLAITKRIVELHKSTLEVESEPGEGSTFSFGLAIAPRTYQLTPGDLPQLTRS